MPMFKARHTSGETKSAGQTSGKKSSVKISTKHVLDNGRWQRRLQKELMKISKDPPPGISLDEESCMANMMQWCVNIKGAPTTLYEGEEFKLQFKFSKQYPFCAPQTMFVGKCIPMHPHIYSNGHICLSILSEDWSPALSVESVCLSVLSMLSSCKDKKWPLDNAYYVSTASRLPHVKGWRYDDYNV